LSSSASHSSAIWPNYTLPDFEKFGQGSRQLSGASLLAFSPLVKDIDRHNWETYSTNNQNWIVDGFTDLGIDNPYPREIPNFIYRKTTRSFVPELTLDQYSPVWQMSPPPEDTSIVNFNLFNHPTYYRLVQFADFTRQAVISEVLNTEEVFGTAAPNDGENPQSLIVLPVFKTTSNISSPVVGHVAAVIPWFKLFENILQDSTSSGIYAVLEESCGKSFTYRIDAGNATFEGLGDKHDQAYDDMKVSAKFSSYDGNLTGISGLSDHCEYTMNVYPSVEYESGYRTNRPIYFTCGVIFVFVWVSVVFLFYDRLVQRRQMKINHVATKTNAIVASLFPTQVRDKLINEAAVESRKPAKGVVKGLVESAMPTSNLYNRLWNNDILKESETHDIQNSPPIADLFPSATVLFMDIAGFTAWSSQREPSQVFTLLETIYRHFDKVANRRKVFKVETIGDCYVAGKFSSLPNFLILLISFAKHTNCL